MKKLLVSLALIASLFTATKASAHCILWSPLGNGSNCLAYAPDPGPGARVCTGDPGPNEINLYTHAYASGFCITIPQNGQDLDLGARDWYRSYPLTSIKMGSAPTLQGYIYQGTNGTGQGWALSPGGTYNNLSGLNIHSVMAR